jgi:hypothetical protein
MSIRASSLDILSVSVMSGHFMMTVPANSGPVQWAPRALINFGTLAPGADQAPYYSNANSGALMDFTAAGRSLVAGANANSQAGLLGLTDVRSWNVATGGDYNQYVSSRIVSTDAVWGTQAEVAVTDAATVALNLSSGFNFLWTLGGANRSFAQPVLGKLGQRGRVIVVQSGTAACSLSYHTDFKHSVGTPVAIPVNSGAVSIFYFDVVRSNYIHWVQGGFNVK